MYSGERRSYEKRGGSVVANSNRLEENDRSSNNQQERRGDGRNVCCSVMYAAYYSVSAPRDVTVLVSSLSASPAWLDMVRQMNKDVVCESTLWTDFALTTETAYPPIGLENTHDTAPTQRNPLVSHTTTILGSKDRLQVERRKPGRAGNAIETIRAPDLHSTHASMDYLEDEEFERGAASSTRVRDKQQSRNINDPIVTPRVTEARSLRPESSQDHEDEIPQQAKRVLHRYFYDEFCYRLATAYGVPTLLVLRDRLKRGLWLDEDDRNHQWFVDAMLSDMRFVAAVEVTRSSRCEVSMPQTQQQEVLIESAPRNHQSHNAVPNKEKHSSSSHLSNEERHDANINERQSARRRHAASASLAVSPQATDSFTSSRDNDADGYMFDDDDLTMLPIVPSRLLQSPLGYEVTERDIDRMFDQYESELRGRNEHSAATEIDNDEPRTNALDTTSLPSVTVPDQDYNRVYRISAIEGNNNPVSVGSVKDTTAQSEVKGARNSDMEDAGNVLESDNGFAFKRPFDFDGTSKRRNGSDVASKKRRLFSAEYDQKGKENSDISDSDDVFEGDIRRRRKSVGSYDRWDDVSRRKSIDNEKFEIMNVELNDADVALNANDLIPNTVLLAYRLERRSGNIIRFMRVCRMAASDSNPPIRLADVFWDCNELLEYLQKLFGDEVRWLGKRNCGTERFQLRNLPVSIDFYENIPNLYVLLKRSSTRDQQTVRV